MNADLTMWMKRKTGWIIAFLTFAAVWLAGVPGSAASAAEASTPVRDIDGHPAQGIIEIWLSEGLAKGFEDGTFRPDAPVTRAEFVALAGRVLDLSQRSNVVYSDTPRNAWYLPDLQRLHAAGAIQGFPDGTFRPNQLITRQEAAQMLYRLVTADPVEGTVRADVGIPDLANAGAWSREAITGLARAGYIDPYGRFRPSEPITRAEWIVWLDRYITERKRVRHSEVKPLLVEEFGDKTLAGRQVTDAQGRAVWRINETPEQTYAIAGGALELGGAQHMQLASLQTFDTAKMDSYALEFTINVQRMSNEGHTGRPMAVIIPRTKDANYSQYYGVYYYMETTYMGNIVANLFKTKWAIVNTAAPSGTKPLAVGYYMLRENVDYTARLVIENQPDGAVDIAFYIDGPTDPGDAYTPVVSYTDRSPHKITRSAAGPAFGMTGRANDFWGPPPTLRYDDVRILDIGEYRNYERWLRRNFAARATDIEDHPLRNELKYLVNRGLLDVQAGDKLYPDQRVRESEFADMLKAWSGKAPTGTDDRLLTKERAAGMLYEALGKPNTDFRYQKILQERDVANPGAAVHYLFETGIMGLEKSGRFEAGRILTRAEAALLLLRAMDDGYRLPHGAIRLPSILSSGMVLQRDKPVTIWGTGTSGDTITVKFKDQTKQTVVRDGRWEVVLDPEPHSGPYTLTVAGTAEQVTLQDILVGEVFIVAGQSNAEMSIDEVNDTADIFAKYANRSNLRYYFADQVMAVKPRFDDGGAWTIAEPWAIGYSSAIGTFFANKLLELNKDLQDVPIGIIRVTYGGSTIEVFLPDTFFASIGYKQQHEDPIMSGYWNGFIHTVAPFAAKAVLYYQGENSTQLGYAYESLLRAFIAAIRDEFRDPNLPFFLVQLAGYGENYYETDIDSWPVIREIQMRVANTVPNVAVVTAVDLGDRDPLEIHPKDKRPIGERAAYRAMERLYGDSSYREVRSPEMREWTLSAGGEYTIRFDYVTGGLTLKQVPNLTYTGESGFEVLDSSGRWRPAQARVTDDRTSVVVSLPGESRPQGVRYAWRNYPAVTLFDVTGFPALPFNSTKDVKRVPPVIGTDGNHIRVNHHLLKSYDGIVNLTRGGQFRMIEAVDGYTLWHEYAIPGQSPGDEILLLARLDNAAAGQGTNATVIRLAGHGLKAGDWIRNNSRGWIAARVARVIDANTFEIETPIAGQSAGDELERYAQKRVVKALGEKDITN